VEERPDVGALRGATLLFLLALLCGAMFVFLDPLLSYALFGSDTGEYYRLTELLLAHGQLPVGGALTGGYAGWGYAYPDFPGLFVLTGSFAEATGTSVFATLTVAVPAITALSVLPLFLLFRRIYPHDTIALLGAGFATVAMPRLFSIAHPAPLAIGDLLAVAALWMFVEGRRDVRWYGPLALLSAALIVTHHLSSYFFLLSALGGLLLLELWRPSAWSRRFPARELALLAAFTVGLVLFWFGYATDFRGVLAQGSVPAALVADPAPLVAGALAAFLLLAAGIRWRRARGGRPVRVRVPSDRSLLRDGALIAGAMAVGLGALLVVPLPATSQTISAGALAWFSPFVLTAGFAAGSRRWIGFARLGPFALTWLTALGASALFAIATSNPVLLPSRHAEYLVIPLGLLVAAVLGYLALRAEQAWGRPGLVACGAGALVLLAANAAIAYPPAADFGGFQEGLTVPDAAMWMWVGVALPNGTVAASDHRLSSMLFGVDGDAATWQTTGALFRGTNWPAAASELISSAAPHCPYRYPVQIVVVDAVMLGGVALDPAAPAAPLNTSWFGDAPFVPIYEEGAQVVYWVDGPLGTSAPVASCGAQGS
jgi:hypothetical protein